MNSTFATPDDRVLFPFLRGTSIHTARITRTTRPHSSSKRTQPNTGAMTHTTCHGASPPPSSFIGSRAQRPFVCLKAPSARSARFTRSTSKNAPSALLAWHATVNGLDWCACSTCSSVIPSSSSADSGTGRSSAHVGEGISVIVRVLLRGQSGPGRRRQAELADVRLQLRPQLPSDRGRAVLLPAALAEHLHPARRDVAVAGVQLRHAH